MSISEEMRLDMIEQIREDLKNVSYPLTFDPTLHKDTNCMAHAFGAEVPDLKHNFYVPGFICGNADDLIATDLVENFINDVHSMICAMPDLVMIRCRFPAKETMDI